MLSAFHVHSLSKNDNEKLMIYGKLKQSTKSTLFIDKRNEVKND